MPLYFKFTDLDEKVDEEPMPPSPWYFRAIHHPDPYQAALCSTAWITVICASF